MTQRVHLWTAAFYAAVVTALNTLEKQYRRTAPPEPDIWFAIITFGP